MRNNIVQKMNWERTLLLLGIFYSTCQDVEANDWHNEAQLSATKLSRNVENFVDTVLGAKNLQDYYDTLDFQHRRLDGNDIAERMASNFGQKIFDRNEVVKDLQKVVRNSLTSSNELTECCNLNVMSMEFDERFKQKVDMQGCYRGSDTQQSSREYLSQRFIEASADYLRRMPFLRWQYFASETGITTIFPGFKVSDCTDYDARFRPFYVQANVPESKDVVLVIDKSTSMNKGHESTTLMNIAKDAARTVVSTLNPHDRVAVIAFSTSTSVMGETNARESCFGAELARSTSENVEKITQFIQEITPTGHTYYGTAVERAFDFFDSTAESSDIAKDRVLLFLSDGQPTEDEKVIIDTLKKRNAKLNHTVIVMTYGLGNANFSVLRKMANEEGELYGEAAEPGRFTRVESPSNLRYAMGSYYSFFSSKTIDSTLEPIWILPYLDKFGLGVMMTVTLPVKDNSGNLAGVVATDLTMDDFLSDAAYFRPSKLSYVFVIDSLGYVIYHPLFEYPTDHDVKYVEISAFERDPHMAEVIESMKSGGSGSTSFESEKITPAGSNGFYGVTGVWVTTNVYWRPIPHSSFSLCVVLTDSDEESSMPELNPSPTDDFLYHRLDLVPPPTPCRHFNNYGAMDQSSMSIGPRGFANTDSYIYNEETISDINALRTYMLTGNGGSTVKSGIRNTIWATQEAERFWKKNQNATFDQFVMWRYVGTKEGGIRIYPGTQLPKEFDSTVRPWYLNGLANRGKSAFTLPYKDATSGEYVMSISKAVFEGKVGFRNENEDEVVAVVSADILTQYWDELLQSSYDMCFRDDSAGEYHCKLVDTAGFILFDNTKSRSSDSPEHITEVEPDISISLLNAGIMEHSKCLITEEVQEQRTYRITGKSFYDGTGDRCHPFTFSPIPLTNVYMIVRTPMPFSCQEAVCRCSSVSLEDRMCMSRSQDCECPCIISYEHFNTCTNNFTAPSSSESEFPKPCVPNPNPLSAVGSNEDNLDNLPKCNIHSYEPPTNPTDNPTPSTNPTNIPAIVGGCVAACVVVFLILTWIVCMKRKRKRSNRRTTNESQDHRRISSPRPIPNTPAMAANNDSIYEPYQYANDQAEIASISISHEHSPRNTPSPTLQDPPDSPYSAAGGFVLHETTNQERFIESMNKDTGTSSVGVASSSLV